MLTIASRLVVALADLEHAGETAENFRSFVSSFLILDEALDDNLDVAAFATLSPLIVGLVVVRLELLLIDLDGEELVARVVALACDKNVVDELAHGLDGLVRGHDVNFSRAVCDQVDETVNMDFDGCECRFHKLANVVAG